MQDISHYSTMYTFDVSVKALDAQTAEEHQAMTTGTGFTNVLSDTSSMSAKSDTPVCYISTDSVTIVNMTEVTDWTGDMVATLTGQVTAEKSCESVSAKVVLRQEPL